MSILDTLTLSQAKTLWDTHQISTQDLAAVFQRERRPYNSGPVGLLLAVMEDLAREAERSKVNG